MYQAHLIFSQKVQLTQDSQNRIKDTIEWRNKPEYTFKGRSGYLKIQENNQPNLALIKLKGMGFFDPETGQAIAPGSDIYEGKSQKNDLGIMEQTTRLSVDAEGNFEFVELESKPFGGQFMKRVDVEFEALESLYNPDGPLLSFVPVAKAFYEDLRFDNQTIGVVAMGLPSADISLLEEYFIVQESNGEINFSAVHGERAGALEIYEKLKKLILSLGFKLNHVHKKYLGIEGHLANCTVLNQTGELLIHDLDFVKSATKLKERQLFNYQIRDLGSFGVAIATNFLFNDLAVLAAQLEIYDENIFNFNLLKLFFESYYDQLHDSFEDYLDDSWNQILKFYFDQLENTQPKDRLLKMHPYLVDLKIQLMNELYQQNIFAWKIQNKILKYSEKDHQANLKKLIKSYKSS